MKLRRRLNTSYQLDRLGIRPISPFESGTLAERKMAELIAMWREGTASEREINVGISALLGAFLLIAVSIASLLQGRWIGDFLVVVLLLLVALNASSLIRIANWATLLGDFRVEKTLALILVVAALLNSFGQAHDFYSGQSAPPATWGSRVILFSIVYCLTFIIARGIKLGEFRFGKWGLFPGWNTWAHLAAIALSTSIFVETLTDSQAAPSPKTTLNSATTVLFVYASFFVFFYAVSRWFRLSEKGTSSDLPIVSLLNEHDKNNLFSVIPIAVQEGNLEAAHKTMTALISLLKKDSAAGDDWPLGKEFKQTHELVDSQILRYPNAVFQDAIQEDLREFPVPCGVLWTLVHNALRYEVANWRSKGVRIVIRVSARTEHRDGVGDVVVIEVANFEENTSPSFDIDKLSLIEPDYKPNGPRHGRLLAATLWSTRYGGGRLLAGHGHARSSYLVRLEVPVLGLKWRSSLRRARTRAGQRIIIQRALAWLGSTALFKKALRWCVTVPSGRMAAIWFDVSESVQKQILGDAFLDRHGIAVPTAANCPAGVYTLLFNPDSKQKRVLGFCVACSGIFWTVFLFFLIQFALEGAGLTPMEYPLLYVILSGSLLVGAVGLFVLPALAWVSRVWIRYGIHCGYTPHVKRVGVTLLNGFLCAAVVFASGLRGGVSSDELIWGTLLAFAIFAYLNAVVVRHFQLFENTSVRFQLADLLSRREAALLWAPIELGIKRARSDAVAAGLALVDQIISTAGGRDNNGYWSLKEEFNLAADVLNNNVQGWRRGALQLEVQLEEAQGTEVVPTLIFWPLICNIVRHQVQVATTEHRLTVKLSARREIRGNRIWVVVEIYSHLGRRDATNESVFEAIESRWVLRPWRRKPVQMSGQGLVLARLQDFRAEACILVSTTNHEGQRRQALTIAWPTQ